MLKFELVVRDDAILIDIIFFGIWLTYLSQSPDKELERGYTQFDLAVWDSPSISLNSYSNIIHLHSK